jgi:deoxyribodipyrimidine photo-lyase
LSNSPSICWFRLDLRLDDNPALTAGVAHAGPVIPAFIWAPEEEEPWRPGAASRWWLHYSLAKLNSQLAQLGSRLILRHGPTEASLAALAKETGATHVFWNRRYEPAILRRDEKLREALAKKITVECFDDCVLFNPDKIRTQSGNPFQVFTPFWKSCLSRPEPPEPLKPPARLTSPSAWPQSLKLDELQLLPQIDWAAGMRAAWQPGTAGAQSMLDRFGENGLGEYPTARDRPDQLGTSRLSPHLHFGEISPRQVWHAIKRVAGGRAAGPLPLKAEPYLRQLGWRDFAHHLLYHFPHTAQEPLRAEFARFPWDSKRSGLRQWQKGQTGYPYIDAGMHELWSTGWMHNRVRMAVASFLVKDLLISWLEGAKWLWDTLVDADLANNTLGWQWTAGCGADAAPYFRIFNPVTQGEKFDPEGEYVRHWVPELSKLPDLWIHQPFNAPTDVLAEAQIKLGERYPRPIVERDVARKQALAALKTIRE